jgi:hypothetical protein
MRETAAMKAPLYSDYAAVPAELRALRQWVIWRYEPVEDRPKPTKVPYVVSGRHRATSTNEQCWSTFADACNAADTPDFCAGIGFVFSENDPYCGIDLDNIWPSDAAETADWATGVVEIFGDTYSEASPSDTGYKIICQAKLPGKGRSWDYRGGAIEVYDRSRFFTITGISNRIRVVTDHQADVEALIADLDAIEQRSSGYIDRPKHHRLAPVDRNIVMSGHVPPGHRHHALLSYAGWLWHLGESVGEVRVKLHQYNQNHCDPPKDLDKVDQIISSMERSWTR